MVLRFWLDQLKKNCIVNALLTCSKELWSILMEKCVCSRWINFIFEGLRGSLKHSRCWQKLRKQVRRIFSSNKFRLDKTKQDNSELIVEDVEEKAVLNVPKLFLSFHQKTESASKGN